MTKYISVGESRQKKWKFFSRATEAVEGAGHSHVFVSWKDDLGLRWVAEARGSGVRIISNEEFKKESEVINIYHYYYETPECHEKIIRYVWKRSGKKYGTGQIVGLLWMRLVGWFCRLFGGRCKISNPFRDGDASQICCEFAIEVASLSNSKIERPDDLENYGLIETRKFNKFYGEQQPQELIDRINGK